MEKTDKDRRLHARIDSVNLVSYQCLDEKGNVLKKGMGRTVNISRGGVLLETHIPIESAFILLMAIDLEEKLIEIKGRVVYSRPGRNGKFETGIRFSDSDEKQIKIITSFVKMYFSRRARARKD
jgi:hypothetical protein